eukprot:CAMPEP_0204231016 /NCGR_PEP_ID=MMETSP0361-20130328/88409_1 /ASSEMBLY_ACC=CAM_ASM_000343 /TAXON_ID=268821 /ORGANISM="Scrippsiella Hangoei, Strain SHTV-5" /LENGTH=44 /DNA_ID= /DNA_START= /DNA_END= /DNA_ORIENTATION=
MQPELKFCTKAYDQKPARVALTELKLFTKACVLDACGTGVTAVR